MLDIEIEPDEGISRTDVLGSGDGSQRTFSAVLSHVPIVPGSFSSVLGNFHGEDNTTGSITGLGIIGSINYTSGAVSITHEATPPSAGAVISATYRSWIPDSREAKDVGNVPTTFHMRNYDELAIVLVQISIGFDLNVKHRTSPVLYCKLVDAPNILHLLVDIALTNLTDDLSNGMMSQASIIPENKVIQLDRSSEI